MVEAMMCHNGEWLKAEIPMAKHSENQTNADRIRNMTDEELAEVLSAKISGCQMCIHRNVVCVTDDYDCKDGVLQWLKSEVKE